MPKKTDEQALHELLWERKDRLGKVRIHQTQLAEELGIAFETVSRVFSRMTKDGRIRKLKAEKTNIGIFFIRDPADFATAEDPRPGESPHGESPDPVAQR